MSEQETYERVSGMVVHTTDKALLLLLDDNREKWIPKSVCGKISARMLDDFEEDDNVEPFVAEWFAKREEIM